MIPELQILPPQLQFAIRLFARGDEAKVDAVALMVDTTRKLSNRGIAAALGVPRQSVDRWAAEWDDALNTAADAMAAQGYDRYSMLGISRPVQPGSEEDARG